MFFKSGHNPATDTSVRFFKYLLLFVAVSIVYSPVIHNGFIWDDNFYPTHPLTSGSWGGLFDIWFKLGSTPQYYPLVYSSFWLENHIWGSGPTAFHITNVILQFFNAVLLWRILSLLRVRGAWFACVIFMLHPVQVESVAWISERKNLLSGFFYLLSIETFLRYRFSTAENTQSGLTSPGMKWNKYYTASLILFLLALFSKTVTCTLPVILILILWWKDKLTWKKDIVSLAPYFLLAVTMALITIWMEHNVVEARGEQWNLTYLQRFIIAGWALWFYIGKLLAPVYLTFIYPKWNIDTGQFWQVYLPFSFIILIVVLWLLRNKVGKGPLAAILFFSITLSPALGFINFYPMRYSYVADHFQYLASIGPIVLFAAACATIYNKYSASSIKRISMLAIGSTVLVILATLSWHRTHVFHNNISLWEDTLTKNPKAWIARNNLGLAILDEGEKKDAIKQFLMAIQINPGEIAPYSNLGLVLNDQHEYKEAAIFLKKALKIDPNDFNANTNLGLTYLKSGFYARAIHYFSRVAGIYKNNAMTYNYLGISYAKEGSIKQARKDFRKAIELQKNYKDAIYNLKLLSKMSPGN